jgi:hypothetical protein
VEMTPKSGMFDGVLILCIIVVREQIGSGRRQTDHHCTGEQSHVDGAERRVYGFSYALATPLKNRITDGILIV